MNGQLEILKSKEKQYDIIHKKTLFNIQLLKETNADEQQIKDTTLDSVRLAIELNRVREQIYQIENSRLISVKATSAEEERKRLSDLVDLASKRKQEIEELFRNQDGLADPELEKQTNEFILYSDKLKIINSYLEVKEKKDLLIHENEELEQQETELKVQMRAYEKENLDIVYQLEEAVDKAMDQMNFSLEDEESILFETANQERNQELNKQILELFANMKEQDIPEEHQKVIQNIKKNRKKDAMDYCLSHEKYFILQTKQIISGMKIDDFSKLYDDLLEVFSLLNNRLKLRQKNKVEEDDELEFFYEIVVSAIRSFEKQIAERTTLDNVITKRQENTKNIDFYTNLIQNSTDIKQLLGELPEEEIEYDEEVPEPEIETEETSLEEISTPQEKVEILPEPQEESIEKEEVILKPVVEETPNVIEEHTTENTILEEIETITTREPQFSEEELLNPQMEEVVDPNTIISVDDASNDLKSVVQASFVKFKNWFTKNWQKINKIKSAPGASRKLK